MSAADPQRLAGRRARPDADRHAFGSGTTFSQGRIRVVPGVLIAGNHGSKGPSWDTRKLAIIDVELYNDEGFIEEGAGATRVYLLLDRLMLAQHNPTAHQRRPVQRRRIGTIGVGQHIGGPKWFQILPGKWHKGMWVGLAREAG